MKEAELSLTEVDHALLEKLRDQKEWVSRSDLAKSLGRTNLAVYHIDRLERLVFFGLVERSEKITGMVKRHFLYRATL